MSNNKSLFQFSKFSKILLLCSLVLLLLAMSIYSYRAKLYTYYWHAKHPKPIRWHNLVITVPHSLMAKFIHVNEDLEDLMIWNLKDSYKATMYFSRENYHLENGFNFEEKFREVGYRVIDKKSYDVDGNPCVWLKSRRAGNKGPKFREDIFFSTKDIHIYYFGNKCYFLEVIDSLKIAEEIAKLLPG